MRWWLRPWRARPPRPRRASRRCLEPKLPLEGRRDGDTGNGTTLPFKFCDDGVPSAAAARRPTWPRRAPWRCRAPTTASARAAGAPTPVETVPGENPTNDDRRARRGRLAARAGSVSPTGDSYPVVVMMHGCCSGSKTSWEATTIDRGGAENWHYNNAWFASRGYVVVTYTSRGFVERQQSGLHRRDPARLATATRSTTTSTWRASWPTWPTSIPARPATRRSTPSGSCPPAGPTAAASPGWR